METLYRDLNSLVIFRHILQAAPMQKFIEAAFLPAGQPGCTLWGIRRFCSRIVGRKLQFFAIPAPPGIGRRKYLYAL